jgi:hypothetical protein
VIEAFQSRTWNSEVLKEGRTQNGKEDCGFKKPTAFSLFQISSRAEMCGMEEGTTPAKALRSPSAGGFRESTRQVRKWYSADQEKGLILETKE